MTFISVADATSHLGIDAKTLHRWLADAHLCVQNHPHDGRKKGISDQQLVLLANQHHRHIPSFSQQPPAPLACEVPALPDALLTLPEQITGLQSQIAALQQQVADLTHLFTQQASMPIINASIPLPRSTKKTDKLVPKPTPARAAPKKPAKPAHVIARVEYAEPGRYVVTCPRRGVLPFEPDTDAWFAWVVEQESFRFVGKEGYFTAHHWWRVPQGAWRAHRKIRNQTHSLRLAPNPELTIAILEQAAQQLQAYLA